ncbi:hypothetical protein ES708_21243 [subsurface metagenome]
MIDIQKEFDELTPENQELVKKVISALSWKQIGMTYIEENLLKEAQKLDKARQKPKPDMGR